MTSEVSSRHLPSIVLQPRSHEFLKKKPWKRSLPSSISIISLISEKKNKIDCKILKPNKTIPNSKSEKLEASAIEILNSGEFYVKNSSVDRNQSWALKRCLGFKKCLSV